MNRIDRAFRDIRFQKRIGFIPYIMSGFPNLKVTENLIKMFDGLGVTTIELGVPFSDPLADGPIIQEASHAAIQGGVTLTKSLDLVCRLRSTIQCPIAIMTYYNIVFQYGHNLIARDCKGAGVDGLIIPDLYPEEDLPLLNQCRQQGVHNILIVSETSSEERMAKLVKWSKGFVYYATHTGTTGIKSKLPSGIASRVQKIRHHTSKPVGVGFGVSRSEHIVSLARYADAAIVGSAIIKIILEAERLSDIHRRVERFVRNIWK